MIEAGLDEMIGPDGEELDVKQLRMEFELAYDVAENEGRFDLTCKEFIEGFERVRSTPCSLEVLHLQREVHALRELFKSELSMLRTHLGITPEAAMEFRRAT